MVVIPLAGAVLAAAVGPRIARWVAVAASLGALVEAWTVARTVAAVGTLHHRVGGWRIPLGIELRADGLAAVMLVTIAVVGAIIVFHAALARKRARPSSSFFPLWLFAAAALDALVLSGDVFNLYVTLELAMLAAVGLVASGGDRSAAHAALRYLLFGLVGSLLYLLGIAILYGEHGALDLSVLATRVAATTPTAVAASLMIAGLCLKAALFPFHAWAPPAYASAAPLAGGLVAALIGKASFYVVLRLWLGLFPPELEARFATVLSVLAAAAILWGSLQALWRPRLTMVTAYSSVAHTGYLFVGLAVGTNRAWAGSIYVAISHAAAVAAMFVAAGTITQAFGNDRVDSLTGLAHRLPVTFAAIALAGTSLMGMPPSGGFVGKWLLLRSAIESERWPLVAIMLVGGVLAAGYVFRLLRGAFLPLPPGEHLRRVPVGGELTAIALAVVSLAIGVVPGPGLELLATRGP
jgi:formate hydrogenlyase subunit 3/multisubunit Na+/H+ antiporter MnhD subunit